MYIPNKDHFKLQEFFPKEFYRKTYPILGNRMWTLIDNRILWTADALRNKYGSMIINDWLWRKEGRSNNYRGFRPNDCEIGATFSQHRFGRALDCKFVNVDTKKIIDEIAYSEYGQFIEYKYITTVELNVTWLHVDVRNHAISKYGIKLITP